MSNKTKFLGGLLAALMIVPVVTEAAEQGTVRKMSMRERVERIRSHYPFSMFYKPKAKVRKVVDELSPLMQKAKNKNPKPRRCFKKPCEQVVMKKVAKPVVEEVKVKKAPVYNEVEEIYDDFIEEVEDEETVISQKPAYLPDLDESEKVVSDSDAILEKYRSRKARRIKKHVAEKKATETEEILEHSKMIREKIEEKLKFCKGEVALKYRGTNVSLDSAKVAEEVKQCMLSPDCEYKKKLAERENEKLRLESIAKAKPAPKLEKENVLIIEDESVNGDVDNDKALTDCRTYEYKAGTKNLVSTYPGILTDIVLQSGETIEQIRVGDKHRWEIDTFTDASSGASHVYVQPIQDGIETNMVILTDRRTYQLSLVTSFFYDSMVAWKYPGEAVMANSVKREAVMEVESADMLTFDYVIQRSKKYDWAPRFIFDDGFNTYIAIDPDEIAKNPPAIFTENRIGNLVLVDYELVDDNIILNKVYTNLQLRVRDEVLKVNRINND